ncbi:glycolate oxidase subunit GlcF [Thiohalomonas denitrificans]|uniref:Glycolate oxidase iron-sulfur subunit n=1 Tax=Thiohalomonas denitrificans TaxID=415747 RepID=A0A1G5QHD4_9GAMM|nr:glycolate oxidase subunit GlcF [Thiohalomonas denitrificans]SCZ61295.1 glycolate oxidase iron-sulfur subunit [Thiohalomonas denitrificans]
MQTAIIAPLRDTPVGQEAERILRSCVHCGFCTATCPTYQVTGDELDGPRGRIYLIKALLEGEQVTSETRRHLDRCLGCRACETTCPSGVRYSRLLDIGRSELARRLPRPADERIKRAALRALIPHPRRFNGLLRIGQAMRPLLPRPWARRIPPKTHFHWPKSGWHPRTMLLLESCGQSRGTPRTNTAAARVLDRLGITLTRIERAGCCGALSHHLDAHSEARAMARNNIDAWWPAIEDGAEAILVTASGCGTMLKEYGELLADDPDYRARAHRIAALAKDLGEVVAKEGIEALSSEHKRQRIAFHSPCSLQHGQQLPGVIERLLVAAGYELTPVSEPHLCCGSAGPYSLLEPTIAGTLRQRKLNALSGSDPEIIATANIGCQLHLQSGTETPVCHWIELIDQALT